MDEKLVHNEWKYINEIALFIHRTEDEHQLRDEFLHLLQNLIKYDYATFYLYKDGKSVNPVGYNLSQSDLKHYMDIEDIDPFLPLRNILTDPKHTTVNVEDYSLTEKIEDTKYYKTTWATKQIKYSIFTGLGYNGIPIGSISLYRKAENQNFSTKDINIMNVLKDHLNIRLWKEMGHNVFKVQKSALHEKYNLTSRELEIIYLWSNGLTDYEITTQLSISKNTLKKHMSNIFSKVGINSRIELIKVIFK